MTNRDFVLWSLSILVVFLQVTSTFGRRPDECVIKCKTAVQEIKQDRVVVDGSKLGQRIIKRFSGNDDVNFVVNNKNPYLYSYKTVVESYPLEQDPNLNFFIDALLPGVVRPPDTQPPVQESGARSCPQNTLDKIIDFEKYSKNSLITSRVSEIMDSKEPILKEYNKFLAISKKIDTGNCEEVCKLGDELRETLSSLLMSDIANVVDEMRTAFKEHQDLFTVLENKINGVEPELLNACNEELEAREYNYRRLEYAFDIAKLIEQGQDGFRSLQLILDEVSRDTQAFNQTVPIPMSYEPKKTIVTVTRINRRTVEKVEEIVAVAEIRSGDNPISLSVGVGLSWIDDVDMTHQKSLAQGMKAADYIAYNTTSSFMGGGVGMINGHLFNLGERRPVTLAASAGFVVREHGGKTKLGYIVGPSLGFRNNSIWITVGLHAAKVEHISGGISMNAGGTEDSQNPLSVENIFRPGTMLAVTFKIR